MEVGRELFIRWSTQLISGARARVLFYLFSSPVFLCGQPRTQDRFAQRKTMVRSYMCGISRRKEEERELDRRKQRERERERRWKERGRRKDFVYLTDCVETQQNEKAYSIWCRLEIATADWNKRNVATRVDKESLSVFMTLSPTPIPPSDSLFLSTLFSPSRRSSQPRSNIVVKLPVNRLTDRVVSASQVASFVPLVSA